MPLICDHIKFGYTRKSPVLEGFSFEFPQGVTVLKGYSGSGKTTLLKILAGYLKIQSGNILTPSGSRITSRRYRRKEASYMFQGINLLPLLSVEGNLRLCAEMAMIPKKQWKPRAEELMNSLGLNTLRKQRASKLSGGQAQRAALARTLMKDASILLLDEPTSGLDDGNTNIIKQLIRKDASKKICIISTHDARLFELADEIIDFDKPISC